MELLTKDEKSLLLFFETAFVDHAGKLNPQHMNNDDVKIAGSWHEVGYIEFGRLPIEYITDSKTHYVFLSDGALKDAHIERTARAKRMQQNRKWKTKNELKAAEA